jgi:hypothetical protein
MPSGRPMTPSPKLMTRSLSEDRLDKQEKTQRHLLNKVLYYEAYKNGSIVGGYDRLVWEISVFFPRGVIGLSVPRSLLP